VRQLILEEPRLTYPLSSTAEIVHDKAFEDVIAKL
jgi:hypothetical protein